jgi:large subunit ribosomal protein L19
MKRIAQIEKSHMRDDHPEFNTGDTVRVHVRIKEGDKERVQVFQGDVISRRGGGTGASFTVRKVSGGIGVERVFPLASPNVAKIEHIRSGVVRRKKLYYLRELTGKSARIRERIVVSSKKGKTQTKAQAKAAAKKATPAAAKDAATKK